ncbi:hypothetical protein [Streptomyces sp. NPDC086519]|uniref:hypothetical protein n=1 Tax=Streptomyces sp. NPDC086519 TaxID=3154863 RepID=UPI00342D1205
MNSARGTAAVAVVLATAGTLLGGTAVAASAATTCASPAYMRELFANTTADESWSRAPASGPDGVREVDLGGPGTVTGMRKGPEVRVNLRALLAAEGGASPWPSSGATPPTRWSA